MLTAYQITVSILLIAVGKRPYAGCPLAELLLKLKLTFLDTYSVFTVLKLPVKSYVGM